MSEWWNNLTLWHQIFYLVAFPSTIIIILQTILMLFGIGNDNADGDTHADCDVESDIGSVDIDGDGIPDIDFETDSDGGFVPHDHANESVSPEHEMGLRMLTVRGVVSFFAVAGWVGVASLDMGLGEGASLLLAVVIGLLMMFVIAWFFKIIGNLQQSGNVDIKNSIGLIADVYLTIPENGKGKVTLIVQGRFIETEATCHDRTVKTGEQVKVIGVNNNILVVSPM